MKIILRNVLQMFKYLIFPEKEVQMSSKKDNYDMMVFIMKKKKKKKKIGIKTLIINKNT